MTPRPWTLSRTSIRRRATRSMCRTSMPTRTSAATRPSPSSVPRTFQLLARFVTSTSGTRPTLCSIRTPILTTKPRSISPGFSRRRPGGLHCDELSTCSNVKPKLLDHLVGEQLQCIGHFEAERPGGLHVDDELELAGLYDGQVGGLRAFEDLTDHDASMTKPIQNFGPVAHQTADFGIFTNGIDRGNCVAHRERRKLDAPAGDEAVPSDEQGVDRLAAKGCEGRLDLAASAGVEHLSLQSEGACSFGYVAQRGLGGGSVCRIGHHGDTSRLGHQIVQEPQPLGDDLLGEEIDASRVAAGPRQAGDKAKLDRVYSHLEDNRDRRGRRFGHERRFVAECGNHGDPPPDEIGHERGQAIVAAIEPMVLDRHVLAFGVADFLEAFTKRSSLACGAFRPPGADESDYRHCRLLCARHHRPRRRRAAEQRDKLAPHHHSITSSARASSVGGTSRPSDLAVLRLMISSTLVTCWTGKSTDFSPLRIRPT